VGAVEELGTIRVNLRVSPQCQPPFTFSTVAFSVRHGDRLSSLLLVKNRLGDEERGFTHILIKGRKPANANPPPGPETCSPDVP
jgi:hypothetical protein